MDTETAIAIVADASAHALTALRDADPTAPVPPCPDWNAAELTWHLAEVQLFWAAIVRDLVMDPASIDTPTRPADDELAPLLQHATETLVDALRSHPPEARCWSWHDGGGSVGWVARRQAHEALIHRVDAELAAGRSPREAAVEVAADGVDELLLQMVHGVPDWGRFESDGTTLAIACTDADAGWVLELGRFTGTSRSGRDYDLDAAMVERAPGAGSASADALIAGRAWDLDRWLWGRGEVEHLAVTGERALAARLRELIASASQ